MTDTQSASPRDRWYAISNADEVDTPAMLVYPARIRENIRRMIAMAGGVQRLRPHVKTHKSTEIIRLQVEAGITKFKCATIAEAEVAALGGGTDILVAHQPAGPKAARLAKLAALFPAVRFSAIVDDASVLRQLSQVMVEASQTLGVLLDLDVGMQRSGIAPGPQAVALYQLAASLPGLETVGLHVYDGQIREPNLAERARITEEAFAPVLALCDELTKAGFKRPLIVAGGTPTFPVHAKHADREVSPGTVLLWDTGYSTRYADLDFMHAAVVMSRVISKPCQNRLCLDLGYKAVASDPPSARVSWLDLPAAQAVVHSEEHITLETNEAHRFAVGDVLYGVPTHVCPTTAMHEHLIVVQDGAAVDRWPVAARNRLLTV